MSMRSELHERLEYLVNYSSQLIFVSGDSIAQQQQNLEAFIYQQHDDTEIAYLTATPDMDSADYRRQLCRQLLGQIVGSFVRPLNELLAPLNHHEGPVMIAIIQAHHMPDQLLQELWDLVLQSRFAGNKQHLNVLLFGNSEWAEKAKKWLPAKNTETPLLISSHQISNTAPPAHTSELEQMLTQHREAFQAHLAKRNVPVVSSEATYNPLKSKRVYVAIALVFLITFGGIIWWQYKSALPSIFSPIEPVVQSNETDIFAGSAFNKIAETHEQSSVSPTLDANVELVTDSQIDSKPNEELTAQNENNQQVVSATSGDLPNSSSMLTAPTQSNTQSEQVLPIKNQEDATNSVENTPNTSLSTGEITEHESINTTDALLTMDDKDSSVPLSDWLLPNQYVIQLVGMKDKVMVNQFIEQYRLTNLVRQYKTIRYGGDWHVVVFHQPFNSIDEARAAISDLPDYPTKNDAFVKKGQQVFDEIKRVTNN